MSINLLLQKVYLNPYLHCTKKTITLHTRGIFLSLLTSHFTFIITLNVYLFWPSRYFVRSNIMIETAAPSAVFWLNPLVYLYTSILLYGSYRTARTQDPVVSKIDYEERTQSHALISFPIRWLYLISHSHEAIPIFVRNF